jgi:hypothetical protein
MESVHAPLDAALGVDAADVGAVHVDVDVDVDIADVGAIQTQGKQ